MGCTEHDFIVFQTAGLLKATDVGNLTARPVSNVQCAHDAPFKVTVTPIRWRTDEEITVEQHDDHICGVKEKELIQVQIWPMLEKNESRNYTRKMNTAKRVFFYLWWCLGMSLVEESAALPQVAHPQRVHRWPVDQWTIRTGHAMTKFQAKGMEVTPGKKASVLEIMGLAGHLGHVVFIFFISAKQQAKQTVAKSQVVCRGLWLDCWIVGTRFESFCELKSLKTIISFLCLLAGIICSFCFCKL